jgi:hypothetical protein
MGHMGNANELIYWANHKYFKETHAIKEVGLVENAEKTKFMFISHHNNS